MSHSNSFISRRNFIKSTVLTGIYSTVMGVPAGTFAAPAPITMRDINVIRLRFPGRLPPQQSSVFSRGERSPGMTMIEIQTDQGIVGRSIPKGSTDLIQSVFTRRLKGENPFYIEKIWEKLYRGGWRKPVVDGTMMKCIGSLDLAMWDMIGKALDMPVYKVLGAFTDTVRVYASAGYYAKGKTIADLVREMEGYVNEGYRAIKMRVGVEDRMTDVQRVKAVREALGPDIDILIDANNRYQWNTYEAIRFGRELEKYNLFWFEEPTDPDDFAGSAEIRRELDIPIVTGESVYTKWGFRELLKARAADIINPDVIEVGGLTEFKKVAGMAAADHVPVAPHGNSYVAMHAIASISNGVIMESFPHIQKYNLALPYYPVKDGYITIPNKPGLGIDIDPAVIEKYKIH